MCASELLQKVLSKSCDFIHTKRLSTLIDMCKALIHGETLTMTQLGNALSEISQTSERHSIKRVSNFLSNPSIQVESFEIQKALARDLLSRFRFARLIVDWTTCPDRSNCILRATLICKRSNIVIYQEVHPEEKLNSTKTQNDFLKKLHEIIPSNVIKILIITDAGFQGEWFKQVGNLKWYYCGRVRGNTQVLLNAKAGWEKAKNYAKNATAYIKFLGKGLLAKSNKLETHMYTYKQKLKPAVKKSKRHNRKARTQRKRHIDSCLEGWFIVTNIPNIDTKTKNIILCHYSDRMKIEASNRTTKSTKYGFGFEDSMTKSIERIKILILLEQIVSFVAWLVGAYTEYTNSDREYANGNVKKKGRRLSLVKLGIRVLKRMVEITYDEIDKMIKKLARKEPSLC